MSSGSQNGTTVGGLQGIQIRDASDVVTQSRLRLMFTTNNSANSGYRGSNAYRSKGNQNSYDFLLQVQRGVREWNGGLSSNVGMGNGITFTAGSIRTIPPSTVPASSATTITISNTIPVPN
jgi:hypothetical protein